MSTDKQFDGSGKGKSGIKYKDDYFYYFQFLLNSAVINPSWYLRVKTEWDLNVFRKQVEVKEGASPSGGTSTEGTGIIDRANEITQRLGEMQIHPGENDSQDPNGQIQEPVQSDNMPAPGEIDDDDIYGDEAPIESERLPDSDPVCYLLIMHRDSTHISNHNRRP